MNKLLANVDFTHMTLEEYLRNQEKKIKANAEKAKDGVKEAWQDTREAAGNAVEKTKDAVDG